MEFLDFYKNIYPSHITKLQNLDTSAIYELKSGVASGKMEVWTIFDGVELIYGEYHGETLYESQLYKRPDILYMTFCLEGDYEALLEGYERRILQKDSFCALNLNIELLDSRMPLGFNKSISFLIYLDIASKEITKILKNICLKTINEKFYENFLILPKDKVFMNIFHQMHTQKYLGIDYMRVKFLELLIYLASKPQSHAIKESDLMKEICAYIQNHCEENYPLSHLAQTFRISLSKLQKDFCKTYDSSIYQYIKHQKIQKAVSLLTQDNRKITEIATEVGYTNISKFCESFKKITGKTPLEYKKLHAQHLANKDFEDIQTR
ncbi:AraC family transcriptional regulator [Helicobacter sp. 11S02596-1]|uniref:helix-turn-helix domain-containing protein n=1 Tax=Helicobacter sp. 11S02596-1 TaxID=1476194 RepID=UPI000BA6DE51|nr:AraC family transcriptional regulator [Helicobacter sp. 11S02596-1]PAF43975.1 hypothetical protein BJI48_04105 [Helicobacter sp. 11S02596-1]